MMFLYLYTEINSTQLNFRMKKYILLLILFATGLILTAQQFHGGVIGGIAGTQVAGDSFSGYN